MNRFSQIQQIQKEYLEVELVLDERSKRRWCAAKARAHNRINGRGGITIVSEATGVSRSRIYRGIKEINQNKEEESSKLRKKGGGRKKNH